VTSQEKQIALLQAMLSLAQAVMNVREMVFAVRGEDVNLFNESFDKSASAMSKVYEQLNVLMDALSKDG
jgi:hypothetical protein